MHRRARRARPAQAVPARRPPALALRQVPVASIRALAPARGARPRSGHRVATIEADTVDHRPPRRTVSLRRDRAALRPNRRRARVLQRHSRVFRSYKRVCRAGRLVGSPPLSGGSPRADRRAVLRPTHGTTNAQPAPAATGRTRPRLLAIARKYLPRVQGCACVLQTWPRTRAPPVAGRAGVEHAHGRAPRAGARALA